ncbi:MAG: peptidoglycan DD-metalloendopeptidase family protein [Gammaproteobacteria bacterium]
MDIFKSNLARCAFIVGLSGTMAACSTGVKPMVQKPAPVLPYGRDLVRGPKYYVVKKGDTLYSIGFRSGHGYQALALWNNIRPPYTVKVGQKIKLFESASSVKGRGDKKASTKTLGKKRNSSQKKPIFSTDNKNLLKLHWQWPIKGRIVKNFSQSGSKGIDISGQLGQSVRAAEAGKVVYSGNGLIGYGNLLIIKHNEMYLSAYANNSKLLVNEGQVVNKSQVIAQVGKLGSGPPALHFEIRKNGKPVNPVNYLPKK